MQKWKVAILLAIGLAACEANQQDVTGTSPEVRQVPLTGPGTCATDVDCAPAVENVPDYLVDLCSIFAFCRETSCFLGVAVVEQCDVVRTCDVDADCNDNSVCTTDTCVVGPMVGYCHNVALEDGTACDDANACTVGNVCSGGMCGVGSALNCTDESMCTNDSCDPASGCVHADVACNDGVVCTVDTCVPATGCAFTPDNTACDDENGCTTDSCDTMSGCQNINNTAECDDANACTVGDICSGGECTAGEPLVCDDHVSCTVNGCDPSFGCMFTANDAVCNDNNVCTRDVCDPFQDCRHANETDGGLCGADSLCYFGMCVNPTVECTSVTDCTGAAFGGIPDWCVQNSSCTEFGNGLEFCLATIPGVEQCTPATAECSNINPCPADNDNNACTESVCVDGRCITGFTPEGTTCDDENFCSGDDRCDGAGVCRGMNPPPNCDDADPCTQDACNPATGQCAYTAAPDGTVCSDSNLCTVGDACLAGECQPGSDPLSCGTDELTCTDDQCDPIRGCYFEPHNERCDDGNDCTVDVCDEDTGCLHTAIPNCPAPPTCGEDGTQCNDGDACTAGDQCVAGVCLGNVVNCDDNEIGTADSCVSATGCVHTPQDIGWDSDPDGVGVGVPGTCHTHGVGWSSPPFFVCDPMMIPPECVYYGQSNPGFLTDPECCTFGGRAPDGTLLCVPGTTYYPGH